MGYCPSGLLSQWAIVPSPGETVEKEIIKFRLYFSSSYNKIKLLSSSLAMRSYEMRILKLVVSLKHIKEKHIFKVLFDVQ